MNEKKVLLVDGDSKASNKIISLLEQQKCSVSVIEGGLNGINKIYKEQPDIVFLDSSISDIPIYQICRLLRSNLEYKDIPIVIIGESEKEELGIFNIRKVMVDYINLSEDLDSINQQIRNLLSKYQKTRLLSKNYRIIEELNKVIYNLAQHYNKNKRLGVEELNSLFEQIVSKISIVLNSEVASLMLLDEESGHLYIKAAKGLNEKVIEKARVKVGEGISGQVVNKNIPVLVSDIENDTRFSKANNSRYYTKSFLSAPLRIGKVRGVININNKTSKEPFNEKDLTLMGLVIGQIHLVLENSDLRSEAENKKEEVQKLRSDRDIFKQINKLLDKELNELEISYQINKILNSDLGYKQTINAVIELVESVIDYHFCGLLILDNVQEAELMVSIKYPATDHDLASFKSRVIDTYYKLSGYNIMLERVSLNRTDGPAILTQDKEEQKNVLSSFYCLPLNIKGKNLGLLAVSHSEKEAFGAREKKFISLIAENSSIAINNAALHKRMEDLSITDGLTGLYCYRFFQMKLEEELKRAQRYQEPLGLVIIDIDGFKNVNDSYGHLTGDKILKEISKMLRDACRDIDIVCRYGGEEFVVILPETNKEGTFYLAERARKAIKNRQFSSPENESIRLTVSCGIASFPDSARDKEKLIKKADDALYKAKEEGKNKTSLIDL